MIDAAPLLSRSGEVMYSGSHKRLVLNELRQTVAARVWALSLPSEHRNEVALGWDMGRKEQQQQQELRLRPPSYSMIAVENDFSHFQGLLV